MLTPSTTSALFEIPATRYMPDFKLPPTSTTRHGDRRALPSTACIVQPTASHGCSFSRNATTPGSSVDDTAKPLSFASEIIAVFSRSASPIIHAVPRERA